MGIGEYNHKQIEKKWQEIWDQNKTFSAENNSEKPKYYALVEFPYPSGAGLHVGHPRSYTALDIISRKRRLEGYNVLYPIGWDAFGLPAENYAIKHKIHPKEAVKINIQVFKAQLKSLGISFDWDREFSTTDEDYYKWTQWQFLQFFKHGLAYKTKTTINWCTSCKVGLANEEVEGGKCERCGGEIEKREKEQWMLKMTAYADKLIEGLNETNFVERVKTSQINWIGKSTGAEVDFEIKGTDKKLKIFTTRPDTLYGVTFMVIAPEHPILKELSSKITNMSEIEKYQEDAQKKSEFERVEIAKDKTGVRINGLNAINPLNGQEIQVWVSDYVMMGYGTGAIMAVPAHDQRDYEFAKKFNIPITQVIAPYFKSNDENRPRPGVETIHRDTAVIVVKHWEKDEVLCLDWTKQGWHSFVIGGIENGEDPKAAAIRELEEETGYYNIKNIKVSEFEIHNEFYAAHKNINRYANTTGIYIELASGDKKEVDEKEKDIHTAHWIGINKLKEYINLEINLFMYDLLLSPSAYTGDGKMINSGVLNGIDNKKDSIKKILEYLEQKGIGKATTNYRLQDWVFSRQRFWGEPIPMINCPKCGYVPVPENQLPVTLPDVAHYEPTDNGESPLANITEWVNTTCPTCGGAAQRETDTMPNWAGSSWYWLRYMDSKNDKEFVSKDALKYWGKVDWYNGGMEHATRHLLYARFWHRFLYDIGLVPTKEPFEIRTAHGMILGENGEKMSKSKGNVVNPDEIVNEFGADTLRTYEMFIGAFEQFAVWSEQGVKGCRRFLDRIWRLQEILVDGDECSKELEPAIHKAIKKVSEDFERMKFNTAIATMMTLVNTIYDAGKITKGEFRILLMLLNPVAPHITEELWKLIGSEGYINEQKWVQYDEAKAKEDEVEIVVQVNGKIIERVKMPVGAKEDEVFGETSKSERLQNLLADKTIVKKIFVTDKLMNIVVR